jgi:DNA helicase II / ATP-dependent DNA helicase PcrA
VNLTAEQQAVIDHPAGFHARVLAVAGSGKTTTLVHRIQHLIVDRGVTPSAIQVLMFNREARDQFYNRLRKLGISKVAVNTFNSLGHRILEKYYPNPNVWTDESDAITRYVRKAIDTLERAEKLGANNKRCY